MNLDLSTPCVLWPRSIDKWGYGKNCDGRLAHRMAFEEAYGPVAPGIEVGHACHDADLSCSGGISCPHRACWNPLHLVAQSRSENQRAGVPGRRTECVNGHSYDEANTYVRPSGQRDCRACIRVRVKKYRQRTVAA